MMVGLKRPEEIKMITTKQINVNLAKEKLKLRHVTTKDIDVSVKVKLPKEPIKPKSVTTTTLPDVADIAEKKRRDDIAKEKKIVMAEKKPWNKMNAKERKKYQVKKVKEKEK